jgi:uncharacterized protein YjeT (DUF2065 family)
MKVIVYLLGFGHIVLCTYVILYTRETVDWFKDLYNTYQLKYMAAIPAVYGLLFLVPASFTTYPWVFRIIAVLSFCEAIVAFTDPQKIYSRLLDWYFENVSDQTQRMFGIIGIVFGTVILTWI